jgi:tetratricopeptide (TPR) repeat protein
MLALYRCGRTGEALARFHTTRLRLADELGIDPGLALKRLQHQILANDPALDAVPAVQASVAEPTYPIQPRQLPPPPVLFTGRVSELNQLTQAMQEALDPAGGVAICTIDGTGGVGKTWLALRWAHAYAAAFPDGQLYVNLHGFGPSAVTVEPTDALHGLLDALGVPAQRVPAGLPARTGLYRSMLAGKRMLVLLDNARDVEQVRPLLPGSPGCLVIVTSRNQLTGLVTADAARPLSLDLPSTSDARALLARRLGPHRLAAEADATDAIIARCARLPLALAIAAARAVTEPRTSLAGIAAQLDDATSRLDAFAADDPATDARTVFSWSYLSLHTEAARLFRLLGLHPGPDISAAAAASLAGRPPEQIRRLLTQLTRAHLLAELTPGRYSLHDLLREYASEQTRRHDNADVREAAIGRVVDHYLHTAHAAAALVRPQRRHIEIVAAQPDVVAEVIDSYDGAVAWFSTEYPVLVAILQQAAATGFDSQTWQLAWALRAFLDLRGLWQEQVATELTALQAARRLGDRTGQANSLHGLAFANIRLDRLEDAEAYLRLGLELNADLDNPAGQAPLHLGLCEIAQKQGRPAEALYHAQQGLALYRAAGNRIGWANALNGVGWAHAQLGEYQQALTFCGQGLALLKELGDRAGQAGTWDSLGYAHRGMGNHAEAVDCYHQAIELYRELGDEFNEADTLANLGDTHHAAGELTGARTAWQSAVEILHRLQHPELTRLRTRLLQLDNLDGGSP